MVHSQSLYDFLIEKSSLLVEEWLENERSDSKKEYQWMSEMNQKKLKEQAISFHKHFFQMLIIDYNVFVEGMDQWINTSVTNRTQTHSNPTERIKDLFRTQNHYLNFVDQFYSDNFSDEKKQVNNQVIEEMQEVIIKVTNKFDQIQEQRALEKKRDYLSAVHTDYFIKSSCGSFTFSR